MTARGAMACCVLLGAVVTGCAGGAGGTPRNDNPVSGAEVAEFTSIQLALQQLRPSWLRRAREFFIDNEYAGSVSGLRRGYNERIRRIELVPGREVVRRFGPCQAPGGTNTIDTQRDPQCGTRPVIHIVLNSGG